jgi:EAL domain-containing protein (putative c-di-GMP-specific phosphodiesterase class I)
VRDRRRIAGELATAFDTERLCSYYQPVIDLETTAVVGFETLARWEHETLGLLGTADFLAVCEEAGLAWRLTERTVDGAMRMLAATTDDITVTVNLSPLQLADDTVTDVVVDAFARHGAPRRSRLVVEVTEQAVLERTTMQGRKVISVLHDLADMGVRIAIDDFGTGTASLARIDQVPAHVLKIDRSFVSGLGERESSPAVIGAVLSLAQALGLTVVAEGVEEPHQAAHLVELGCRLAQGYLYGRAQPFRVAVASAGQRVTS